MAAAANATPLIALDAVVIDTETTGLNPATARVVEVAAVRLDVGRIDEKATFRRLVRPDEPIPAEATRIHGIDAQTVAAAPSFADVWPELSAFMGDAVLIGHSTGYDAAVLARECGRAGIAWQPGAWLDTQLLAQMVEPNLAGHSLDKLAAWLRIEAVDRHSALGDAATTARVFVALIPRLRGLGVRTLAEALRASRGFAERLDSRRPSGWAEPAPVEPAVSPLRIDVYPYRHRARDIMSAPPKSIGPETPLGAALGIMARGRISSLLVFPTDAVPLAAQSGIVTERDVMRVLSEHGAAALELPVRQAMSKPLIAVPADAFAYLAIGRMNRHRIRHLGVTGDSGEVIGVLSARNLLQLRDEGGIELGDEIEQANDVHELGLAWAKLPRVARDLCGEGLSAREVAAVISEELCQTTRRAAVLAERAMKQDGFGDPPASYAFVVLGSAGRGESLLAMDQDNALIWAGDETSEQWDRWFAELGTRAAGLLHQAGVPYCTGGVMAKNPQWRGSLAAWRARVGGWIERSRPQDLLAVDIFFDLRAVHGAAALADDLRRDAFDAAKGEAGFAKLLVEASGPPASGLNWFGSLRTEGGRINLKKTGLFAIVSAARAVAICLHVTARSTPQRLAGIRALGLGMDADLDALDEAHAVLLDLILRQQIEDAEKGRPLSNAVEAKRLTRRERAQLHDALRAIENVDGIAHDLMFAKA